MKKGHAFITDTNINSDMVAVPEPQWLGSSGKSIQMSTRGAPAPVTICVMNHKIHSPYITEGRKSAKDFAVH